MAIDPFLGTRPQRLFLGLMVLQMITVIALIGTSFGLIRNVIGIREQAVKTVPCYFAIFGLAEIFELVLTIDALYLRNIMQLVGILAFHVGMLIYSGLQIHQTKNAILPKGESTCSSLSDCERLWSQVKALLIVVPIVIGVSLVAFGWILHYLYLEFGWTIFHHLGADPRKKRMYRWYQLMILLIKMDWFFFTGLTLQLLILVLQENTAEFGATIAAIPVVLVLLGACAIALKREIKWLMAICLVLFCLSQGYFIFKFVRYYEPDTRDQYVTTRATLSVFTIIAFLIDFTSFFVGIRCFADFDKGLRDPKTNGKRRELLRVHELSEVEAPISKSKIANSAPGTPMFERNMSYGGGIPLQPRMSIE